VLAVKPQAMQAACEQIAAQCQIKRPLIISIAAGVLINSIDTWLGGELPIIRCMPNTPALVQSGVTGLFANTEVTDAQRLLADDILSSVGTAIWIENESLLDAVTAISGSGPAYFFYLIEAMIDAGQTLGLSETQSRQLTIATATGAAKLISSSDQTAHALRLAVTSKGGTTEAAINTLQEHDMKNIIELAIKNAAIRSHQLSEPSQ
jgi:pyrroline-5-carboxylate reductase